jgi:oligoendopeptidase F
MELELIKALGEGGTTTLCVVAVVIIFLRQMQAMYKDFNESKKEIVESFREHNKSVADQMLENQKAFREEFRKIVDDHRKITEAMVASINAMEGAVKEVPNKLSDRCSLSIVNRRAAQESREA